MDRSLIYSELSQASKIDNLFPAVAALTSCEVRDVHRSREMAK